GSLDGRADGDEFFQSGQLLEIRGDARDAVGALVHRFLFQALDGGVAALGDELRQIVDLTAGDGSQPAGDPAEKAERLNTVANDNAPWHPTLLSQAVKLIAGKSTDDHRSTLKEEKD